MKHQLLLQEPSIIAPLDKNYRPAVLSHRAFFDVLQKSGDGIPVTVALEQADGSVSHAKRRIAPPNHPLSRYNFGFVERLVKFLLWSRGGYKIYFAGPKEIATALQHYFDTTQTGKFDSDLIGRRIYDKNIQVTHVTPKDIPPIKINSAPLGRHLDGCRIGFDLGASDRKVAAVLNGEVVFSEETPWLPRDVSDPQWHYDRVNESLKLAAKHLPRVDAIGGSSAGAYVNNQVKVASLFRGVPEELFNTKVRNLFLDLQKAWGGIPFEVVNDGEVTALAGSMSLGANAVLGCALGSSQAGGYVDRQGNITTWLNELAFVPIDYAPNAPADEWSGDIGCGVQYFSQQAVGRLLPASGLPVDASLGLPENLVEVQNFMKKGDERAAKIYETIGVYLGYTMPLYAEFYDYDHLLLLGRVTTGQGGDIIVEKAKQVLEREFPDLAANLQIHMPDEKTKRHGQAVAAASLPMVAR